ncbi:MULTISPECIES: hypothetical protein [unclassified Streptomyces]|uniref:hypothetical protein n=1 Tax=unclassified Streptomyces TaxID=2593676 RepID=UPI002259D76A|nr:MULTISPECIES: hypothetical protein [unclassified Streptomyces]MCX4511376.1 hypothetical protein [Streptomyces sp. NBC_01619]
MKRNSSGRMLDHGRRVSMVLVALLLLVAGVWSSWGTAQHVLLSKGREHGTLTVASCGEKTCTGPFDPDGAGTARTGLTIERSVAVDKGAKLPVVVKPGTDEVVRTGWPGALHAWLPFGGALLLAACVIGGGLRMPRTAWATAAAGGALLVSAFFAL